MDGPAPRRHVPRPRLRAGATALALLTAGAGLAACSEDGPPVVTDSEYREHVVDLCDRHMPPLLDEWDELRARTFSDAELAAFYRSDMVPRVRSIVRGARNGGMPPDGVIHQAINDAGLALQEIENDAAALIDRRRDGTFLEGENPWVNLNAALEDAGIGCAVEPSNWEP